MKMIICMLIGMTAGVAGFAQDYRVCPPWQVTVENENGQPLAGVSVVQEWGYAFGYAITNATFNAVTDASGRVQFPDRRVTAPEASSKFKKFVNRYSVHGATGPWANIYVCKPGCEIALVNAQNDSAAVYTADGIVTRVTLRPAKPAP